MLVRKRIFEETYGGKKILNLKVNNLDFYYIDKNSNGNIIIVLNQLGYTIKSDYQILKLYEKEFITLKNKAIQNICKLIYDLQIRFDDIVLNHHILNKNDNELLSLLLNGQLHSNNRQQINNFTNDSEIIEFVNNYIDFSNEKFQKSIFRLNYINQSIKAYKDILDNIHNITYNDIVK